MANIFFVLKRFGREDSFHIDQLNEDTTTLAPLATLYWGIPNMKTCIFVKNENTVHCLYELGCEWFWVVLLFFNLFCWCLWSLNKGLLLCKTFLVLYLSCEKDPNTSQRSREKRRAMHGGCGRYSTSVHLTRSWDASHQIVISAYKETFLLYLDKSKNWCFQERVRSSQQKIAKKAPDKLYAFLEQGIAYWKRMALLQKYFLYSSWPLRH